MYQHLFLETLLPEISTLDSDLNGKISAEFPQIDFSRPFKAGIRRESDFKLGTELEFIVVDRESLRMIPYRGGVEELLKDLIKQHHWYPIYEGENLIALKRHSEQVTIEPGGVIEYSSPPVASVTQLEPLVWNFLRELIAAARLLGFGVLPLGYHPYQTPDSVELMPKSRYEIMYSYMPRVGASGRKMMKLTASTQVAIDYSSEADAMRKLRLASLCTPSFIALSANSSLAEGTISSHASYRAHVWTETDNSRTGLPQFVFNKRSTFQDYIDWALSAPVYFVERNGDKLPLLNTTFENFVAENDISPQQLEKDWELHLSTLFPWVRLRSYLEIRAFDMSGFESSLAACALVRGLFYNSWALSKLDALLRSRHRETIEGLLRTAIDDGLSGHVGPLTVFEVTASILEIAAEGLTELGGNENRYLAPFWNKLRGWEFRGTARRSEKNLTPYIKEQLL